MEQNSNLENLVTRRYLVSGRVQGVWFRAATKEQAALCEVNGYARNLQNGSVEVVVQGKDQNVSKLFEWLHQGSRLARVEAVVEVDASGSLVFDDFKVM